MRCPTCCRECERGASKNFELAETVSALRKYCEKPDRSMENPTKCSECLKIDDEIDMFVCRNCVNDALRYDVIGAPRIQTEVNIETLTLCGSCAIKNHLTLEHEVVSYFPISSALHFESHISSVCLLKEKLYLQYHEANEAYSHFGNTFSSFNQELEKMIGMMRKSKSSSVQQEFSKRIEEEVGRMLTHIQSISSAIMRSEEEYKENFENLETRNWSEEMFKCIDLPVRKAETKCSQCTTKHASIRLLCCKTCDEVVKKLVTHDYDLSVADAIDLDASPICSNCVIDGHLEANHEIVKFSVVQNKLLSLKRLISVEKQSKDLRGEFTRLLEVFNFYITKIEEYDDKISKMSKIATESREDPDHEEYIKSVQSCLDQAERDITSLQQNTP